MKIAAHIVATFFGLIVINILCLHAFVVKGGFEAPHAFITVAALFLLWTERKAFVGLVNHNDEPAVAAN